MIQPFKEHVPISYGDEAQIGGDFYVSLQLGAWSKRDVEKLPVLWVMSSIEAFSDIGRYGDSCPAQLWN